MSVFVFYFYIFSQKSAAAKSGTKKVLVRKSGNTKCPFRVFCCRVRAILWLEIFRTRSCPWRSRAYLKEKEVVHFFRCCKNAQTRFISKSSTKMWLWCKLFLWCYCAEINLFGFKIHFCKCLPLKNLIFSNVAWIGHTVISHYFLLPVSAGAGYKPLNLE